jgi:alpha-N-acetylgalactosaminidase
MGWMSWGIFRCQLDCASHPNDCIDESLYTSTADALASDGFADAGYRTVHMDDCWQNGPKGAPSGGRDPTTKRLVANTSRFPNGMKAVAAKVHAMNISFASYTAEGAKTCGQYSGSAGHEARDAATFADWGVRLLRGMLLLRRSLSLSVSLSRARMPALKTAALLNLLRTDVHWEQVDYLKVDGCGSLAYYATGYPAMGAALASSGRSIVYSCSWPVIISIRCHAAGLQPTTGQFSLCHSAAPACLNL